MFKLHDQIWVVPNFIEAESLNTLYSSIKSKEADEWFRDGSPKESFWYGRSLHKTALDEGSQRVIISVENNLASSFSEYERIHEIQSILRTINDGRHLGYHQDNSAPGDENNRFGIVVYINDNYEGGEIHYKNLNIQYKPSQGDLVVHYAGLEHGVTEVSSGERYILTSFVKGTRDTKFLGETSGS